MEEASFLQTLGLDGLEHVAAGLAVAALAALAGGLFLAGQMFGRREHEGGQFELRMGLKEAREQLDAAEAALREKEREMQRLSSSLEETRRRAAADGDALMRIHDAIEHGFDRNLGENPAWRSQASRMPIIVIGNLKGGVGKTTLTANLGAYFGDQRFRRGRDGKPTLFIDFDFQGSMSSILLTAGRNFESGGMIQNENRASLLFQPGLDGAEALTLGREIPREHLEGGQFFDASVDLASHEERLFYDWVFDPGRGGDARLRLGSVLYSPEVQDRFGAVVIDLPPRTTLFAYNALCAATHVVVPTRDDRLSTQAALTFVQFLELGRQEFWPRLNIAGLVGLNTAQQPQHSDQVDRALEQTARDISQLWMGPQPNIPYCGKIAWMRQIAETAGEDFAYFNETSQVVAGSPHQVFTELGDNIRHNIGLL